MLKFILRYLLPLVTFTVLMAGCSSYQPTKNMWKSTKGFWNTYLSPPAEVNYSEKSDLSKQSLALTNSMMGVDVELERLERVMHNADKPPSRAWVTDFLTKFPWISGFAGVKYDGTILGQEPASPMKQLDFIPLLYEDKKQGSRALRGDVQNTPLGPEVLLAVPLYDGVDFLGVVATHFDMRTLMQQSGTPENIVVLSPQALLWAGKYDYAATPLSGVNWEEAVAKSSAGTCKNATGSFYYIVRYLGNLPLVFAVVESGTFPEGSGDVEQALAFFPKEREKLPPPPMPEKKNKEASMEGQQVDLPLAPGKRESDGVVPVRAGDGARDIQPGSSESALTKKGTERKSRVEERHLDGENVPVERVQRPRRAVQNPPQSDVAPPLIPQPQRIERPSPFGPASQPQDSAPPAQTTEPQQETPTSDRQPASPSSESAQPADKTEKPDGAPASPPTTLPGGRPSPFGPQN